MLLVQRTRRGRSHGHHDSQLASSEAGSFIALVIGMAPAGAEESCRGNAQGASGAAMPPRRTVSGAILHCTHYRGRPRGFGGRVMRKTWGAVFALTFIGSAYAEDKGHHTHHGDRSQ